MLNNIAAFSRRKFLRQASYFGAFYALAETMPLPALARNLSDDPRISSTPVADAGFASVRKIGDGVYATISDPTKGLTTLCNGGFVFGKDAALLIEGFVTANGAAFQLDALHKVAQVPPAGALDSHYHYDHSCGNSVYIALGIPLWAHSAVPQRITESYAPLQASERAALLAPFEKRVADAKSEVAKQRAQSDLAAFSGVVDIIKKTTLTLPNRSLDPAKLPLNVDLGGYPVVIESYPGHSGTDLIVRVPEQKVVFTGDLIFNGSYPACFDERATISGWRATLKTFASFPKDTLFVPGHGQICGQEGVARLGNVFDDIAEQAEAFHKAGIPVAEAVDRYVVPEKFKSFGIWAWGYCLGDAITKLYAEWGVK